MMVAILMMACGVSPEEKQQRRANAFDVSGRYEVNTEYQYRDSMIFQIDNEEERSNIYAIVERDGFSSEELKAFERQDISLNDVENVRSRFILGRGKHNVLEGGENISDDMGESSRIFLKTGRLEEISLENYKVEYVIRASIKKSDFVLIGGLTLLISKKVYDDTFSSHIWNIVETIKTPFVANSKGIFYRQYFGSWSGLINSDSAEVISALSSIQIVEHDQSYEISTTEKEFTLDGEVFKLTASERNLEELSENEFPEVYLEFKGSNGSKILILGNIYSLGNLTGIILNIDSDGNESQIGHLQYQKK